MELTEVPPTLKDHNDIISDSLYFCGLSHCPLIAACEELRSDVQSFRLW